jgi:gamma-glutamyltranspeptidase/glutathione hydrolase
MAGFPPRVRKTCHRLALLTCVVPLTLAASRAPTHGTRGMVATSHPLASQAGLEMLRKGGTAVDAAVAATLAIGVVEPMSAGLGGGGFALAYRAGERTVAALDFRERAPLGATRDMYLDARGAVRPLLSQQGHLAVAVPGTVAGLWELHRHGGSLPWKDVVAPAVRLADEGFEVGPKLHDSLQETLAALRANPESARTFLKADRPYDVGDLLIQRDLADTLRALQAEGPQAFYGGDIARAITADMEEHGGLITMDDLVSYLPQWRLPIWGTYRGHTVVSFPPPSSGGVHLLQMLSFLGQQDLQALGRASAAYDHALIEAMRRAYADRAVWLGDPAFVDVPTQGLLHPGYLRARWATFQPGLATPPARLQAGDPTAFVPHAPAAPSTPGTPSPSPEPEHTAHISVVDARGNAVSLTFTVNTHMGACITVPGTGILLNNEMDDFSAAPGAPNAFGLTGGEANAIAPAKIPLSSMTPTLVFAGGQPLAARPGTLPLLTTTPAHALRLVVGAPGGSTIITTVLQAILNLLDFGQDVEAAIAAPRIHHQWKPHQVRAEPDAIPKDVLRGLFARGHTVKTTRVWGNATAVEVRGSGLYGASDPRGEGAPAGY